MTQLFVLGAAYALAIAAGSYAAGSWDLGDLEKFLGKILKNFFRK